MRFFTHRRRFSTLSEQEIIALAISSEEEDSRIFRSFAAHLRAAYPASAAVFDGMASEEDSHRQQLIDLHIRRFGDHIPLLRRDHVAGYYERKPIWLMQNLFLERIRTEATAMEQQAERFYLAAAQRCNDAAPGGYWPIWRPAKRRITLPRCALKARI